MSQRLGWTPRRGGGCGTYSFLSRNRWYYIDLLLNQSIGPLIYIVSFIYICIIINIFIDLPLDLSFNLSMMEYESIYQLIYWSLSIYLSFYLLIYLSVLSIDLFNYRSIYSSVNTSVRLIGQSCWPPISWKRLTSWGTG